MPRPCKFRNISHCSEAVYFKSRAIALSQLEEVSLAMDELESLRLADLEGKYHEEGAAFMGVSRQTFGNILESARKKVADALVNSKALRIEGGRINIISNITSKKCRRRKNEDMHSNQPGPGAKIGCRRAFRRGTHIFDR